MLDDKDHVHIPSIIPPYLYSYVSILSYQQNLSENFTDKANKVEKVRFESDIVNLFQKFVAKLRDLVQLWYTLFKDNF